jgi:NhaP-type Na+/H+ or K+/H+ antiporter
MVVFILNGVLFMLIGLQLPQVVHSLAPGSATQMAKLALLIVCVMVVVSFCLDIRNELFAAACRRQVPS